MYVLTLQSYLQSFNTYLKKKKHVLNHLGKFGQDFREAFVKLGLLEIISLEQGVEILQRHRANVVEERDLGFTEKKKKSR